jgi:hypothetical protein
MKVLCAAPWRPVRGMAERPGLWAENAEFRGISWVSGPSERGRTALSGRPRLSASCP